MISKYAFSNFYSFKEETEVSFEVGKKPSPSYFDVKLADNSRLNTVISIVGANGSGKTQLLRPLAFLSYFISSSFPRIEPEGKIPLRPHLLHEGSATEFVIDFYIENEKYRYKLIATQKEVVHESLHKKTSHLYSYIFTRDLVKKKYIYKQQNGVFFNKSLAEKTRGNVSLISAAYLHDSEPAKTFVEYFSNCSFNIHVSGRHEYADSALLESAEFFHKNKDFQQAIDALLCELDLGLCSTEIDTVNAELEKGEKEKVFIPVGIHKAGDVSFRLPFFDESSGTKSIYVLLRNILPVLKTGGLAILDEIDNDLHLHMLGKIIDLFKFKHTNPLNAQLIFTCHTHEVLNIFKKHQIYLVEKENVYSEAWRLDEVIGLRADDNIYAKYQAGALGAIPNI